MKYFKETVEEIEEKDISEIKLKTNEKISEIEEISFNHIKLAAANAEILSENISLKV